VANGPNIFQMLLVIIIIIMTVRMILSVIEYDGLCFSCGDVVITDVIDIEENIWSPRFVIFQHLRLSHRIFMKLLYYIFIIVCAVFVLCLKFIFREQQHFSNIIGIE